MYSTKRCSLHSKYKCRLLNSMECHSCTQLGWMDSRRPFWNTWKMFFFGLCHWKSLFSFDCISFVSPNNVPLSSFHLLWTCFFLHSLPIFGLQRRFPKCRGKKLKSRFVLSSILSKRVFSIFLYFTCTSFSLQLWWTRWSHITENVLRGINKVEVIKT